LDFKRLTRTATLSVWECPLCFSEFAISGKALKCPKCGYPKEGSDFELQLKRAKSEIRNLIREKGYVLERTELQPILDTLVSDFPKVQLADILGRLELDRDKIHREKYDLELHEYVEVSERKKCAKREEGIEEESPRRTLERALAEEETSEDYVTLLLERLKRSKFSD
jgi:hypothetical protein